MLIDIYLKNALIPKRYQKEIALRPAAKKFVNKKIIIFYC